MRHRNGLRKLNRTSEHRKAMFRNMAVLAAATRSHQDHLPKAKELRRIVEPLITLAKGSHRRQSSSWPLIACATATS